MSDQIRELKAIRYGIGIAAGFILIGIGTVSESDNGTFAVIIGVMVLATCGLNRLILFLDMYQARKRHENQAKASATKPPRAHRGRGSDAA